MLEVRDGSSEPMRIPIGPNVLRSGHVSYNRKSSLVRITLTLAGNGISRSEDATYFAPEPRPADSLVARIVPSARPVIAPVAFLPDPPKKEIEVERAGKRRGTPRVFQAPPERFARAANPAANALLTLVEPPALRPDISITVPQVQASLNLPLPKSAPNKSSATFGRLIWTGQLPKHAILSFSGQGASAGYLNGWVPKAPVHIDVHSAELIEGGMVVYSKDRTVSSEAPSPRNGWNTVLYKWDFARASEVEVLEPPGPGNNWDHLVLRNGDHAISLIVLDWRLNN
jgi:hypothetical protein